MGLIFIVIGGLVFYFLILSGKQKAQERRQAEEQRVLTLPDITFLQEFGGLSQQAAHRSNKYIQMKMAGQIVPSIIRKTSGHIYVVPAKLVKTERGYGTGSKSYETKKLDSIFDNYEYDFEVGTAKTVFKIGFTTRSVAKRIAELNGPKCGQNYKLWLFNQDIYRTYHIPRSIEYFESEIHIELAFDCVLGELFFESFATIDDTIQKVIANSIKS